MVPYRCLARFANTVWIGCQEWKSTTARGPQSWRKRLLAHEIPRPWSLLQVSEEQEDKSGMLFFGGRLGTPHQQLFCWGHSGCLGPLIQLGMGKPSMGKESWRHRGQVGGLANYATVILRHQLLCMMLTAMPVLVPMPIFLGFLGDMSWQRVNVSSQAVRNTRAMASLLSSLPSPDRRCPESPDTVSLPLHLRKHIRNRAT